MDKPENERHAVTIDPSLFFGLPTIDHRRMTAQQVAEAWWTGGLTLEEIENAWMGMNRGAILVACWYMTRYGSRTWRKRWAEWMKIADVKLWYGRYSSCPMPPQPGQKLPEGG